MLVRLEPARTPPPDNLREFREEMDRAAGVWITSVNPKEQLLLKRIL
ncbi:hypothetical protein ANCCAN_13292 [Ancylostoma caninum]|uniref:Uncharacterized protein n=1 Tax=Ancylostoma caninum TaxID=29170 RepID=A0A368G8U6_ANCCA|nr:hypothetical protein ANCCAN_13292 [Ancylostoma caninum]